MRTTPLALLVVCIAGCATLVQDSHLDQRYGAPDPTRFDSPAAPPGGMSFRKDVQPILERRCVVCHGCYDAPCQIKLGAWEGIARGSSTGAVYDGGRLREAPTTRLFVDAQRPSEWRKKGFFPILNERAPTLRRESRGERALPESRAKARASAARRRGAPEAVRLLARPDAVVPAHRAVRRL